MTTEPTVVGMWVNPARHHTVKSLRERFESPSMSPGRWARFSCNVWTGGEEPWISAAAWDSLKVDIGQVEEGEPVWISVDVGTNPAIAIAARRPDEAVAVRVELFDGAVPLEVIEDRLVDLASDYQVKEVTFDRVGFQRSAELLEARGLPMVEIPHSPERISIVSMTLHRLIEAEKLHHDGDPGLRRQVLAGTTKETERGWRLVKSPQVRGLVALAMAVHQATNVVKKRPPRIYFLEAK